MKLGDAAETTRTFSAEDVRRYAGLADHRVGDAVPEPLIAGLFSYLLGAKLPGFGTNYLKQRLVFHDAAPVDVPLTARVEITRLRPEKQLVDLATTCRGPNGALLAEGRALVLVKDVGKA